ncbi:MAG: hypothetical protein JXB24_10315 [Bacteroidales bacterium]|nr:hypothetical protein [Bacteroidales bacterium]
MNIRIGKIAIYGSAKEIEVAKAILEQHLPAEQFNGNESKARLLIQSLIDEQKIKARILWDGNSVWSKRRITKDIRTVLRKGMHTMSDYLYEFFHLCCGSIAHYNKQGWICEYPSIDSLRNFFEHNEYGSSVLVHQPYWAADRIEIIKDINQLLGIKEGS